jgi:hypothetical protein
MKSERDYLIGEILKKFTRLAQSHEYSLSKERTVREILSIMANDHEDVSELIEEIISKN